MKEFARRTLLLALLVALMSYGIALHGKPRAHAASGYEWITAPATGSRTTPQSSESDVSTSIDGRYNAYISQKNDLVLGVNGGEPHTFLYDNYTHQNQLISVDSLGSLLPGWSGSVKISANGRYVAFTEVIPTDDGGQTSRIYVRDMSTDTTSVASVNDHGTVVDSRYLMLEGISDNGICLFYVSSPGIYYVSNPYPNSWLYIHSVSTGATSQVPELSNFPGWHVGTGGSRISADGSTILTGLFEDSYYLRGPHIGLIKVGTWQAENISGSIDGSIQNSSTYSPEVMSMSPNGRFAVIDVIDYWVWDDQLKTLTELKNNDADHLIASFPNDYAISNDGRYIGAKTFATNSQYSWTYNLSIVDRINETLQVIVPYSDAQYPYPAQNGYDAGIQMFTFAPGTGQFVVSTPYSLNPNDTVDLSYDLYETTDTPLQTDTTPPTITALVSPQPNSYGWNNSDVTVSFSCSDADSGVATCSSPVTLTNEGTNQTVTGSATDNAGNNARTTATVNIDKTPPNITYSVSPSPNINGWNQDGVTVTFNCNDALSGIASCTDPVFVSTEGASQTITGTAVDKAGNTSSVTATINVDKTAPTINYTVSPTPNSDGWNNTDVTVTYSCNDILSGIDSCSNSSTVSTEGANQTVTGTATDNAGNTSSATATVNIDKTAPSITANVTPAPNSNGWNNSDVTVTFSCNDSLSGIAVCPSPVTLSSEGGGQIITGTATDNTGNSASTSVMVNIDKTAPVVSNLSWSINPVQQGQNTVLMASASDALSGVSAVDYSINGGTPQPMSYDPISGNWIVSFGSNLAANTYSITVYTTDAAGNTSSGINDILAVYTTANGYVTGHAKVLPTTSDTLPIALDTSKNPANLVMGFTNVTAPMSGSFDMDYSIKNNQNEFSLSSTSVDWVIVADNSHASILGQADMTTYVNGVETVTQNLSVRYDISLGANGAPSYVSVKLYDPGVDPNTGNPAYTINDQVEANGSNLMIHS